MFFLSQAGAEDRLHPIGTSELAAATVIINLVLVGVRPAAT